MGFPPLSDNQNKADYMKMSRTYSRIEFMAGNILDGRGSFLINLGKSTPRIPVSRLKWVLLYCHSGPYP